MNAYACLNGTTVTCLHLTLQDANTCSECENKNASKIDYVKTTLGFTQEINQMQANMLMTTFRMNPTIPTTSNQCVVVPITFNLNT